MDDRLSGLLAPQATIATFTTVYLGVAPLRIAGYLGVGLDSYRALTVAGVGYIAGLVVITSIHMYSLQRRLRRVDDPNADRGPSPSAPTGWGTALGSMVAGGVGVAVAPAGMAAGGVVGALVGNEVEVQWRSGRETDVQTSGETPVQDRIEEVEDRIDTRLDTIEHRIDESGSSPATDDEVVDRLDEIESWVEAVATQVDEMHSGSGAVDREGEGPASVEGRIDDVEEQLQGIEERLALMPEESTINKPLINIDDRLAQIDQSLAAIRENGTDAEVTQLLSAIDEDVATIEARLDAIEDRIGADGADEGDAEEVTRDDDEEELEEIEEDFDFDEGFLGVDEANDELLK